MAETPLVTWAVLESRFGAEDCRRVVSNATASVVASLSDLLAIIPFVALSFLVALPFCCLCPSWKQFLLQQQFDFHAQPSLGVIITTVGAPLVQGGFIRHD